MHFLKAHPCTEFEYGHNGHMKKASISYLKNNLSASIRQVKEGESVLITDQNQAVAVIKPITADTGNPQLESLISKGVLRPPVSPLVVDQLFNHPRATCSMSLTEALLEERNER
jgi:antitoxin (DNA-binding transcriptional repressor) of toxin-antitoxin stability system